MSNLRGGRQTLLDAFPVQDTDAVSLEDTGLAEGLTDTAPTLIGEGTLSTSESKYYRDSCRVVPDRVPVLAPDGEPLMPTKPSRARKWLESGRAIPLRTKLNLFAVQLLEEPSGRSKQPIVMGIDPGSKFTGIAVASAQRVLCGFNLELPDWTSEKVNKHTKTTKKMKKRREKRRTRRYRKCRRRRCRVLNKSKHKIPPSIKSRKQLELRVVRELAKTYPITNIALEDVAYNHWTKSHGSNFSQVEVGKNWLISELEKIANVTEFKGWQTSSKRKSLGLSKSSDKSDRNPEAHAHDAVALCSLVMDINITNFHFDVVRRPKYSRRMLHLEQPSKGGARRQYGGTTTPFNVRKGDYVEATQGSKTVKGWVSGYTKNQVSVSDFDWKRLGQFVVSKVKLLERDTGLLTRSKEVKKVSPTAKACGFPT